jgi:hypothetical protein
MPDPASRPELEGKVAEAIRAERQQHNAIHLLEVPSDRDLARAAIAAYERHDFHEEVRALHTVTRQRDEARAKLAAYERKRPQPGEHWDTAGALECTHPDHEDRKAISYTARCRDCHREFMAERPQLTAEEAKAALGAASFAPHSVLQEAPVAAVLAKLRALASRPAETDDALQES